MNELRCIIGGDNINYPYPVEDFLLLEGHIIVAKQKYTRQLLQSVINIKPDVIIINTSILGDSLLEICKDISEQKIGPIVVISNHFDKDTFNQLVKVDVFSYLIVPVTRDNFITSIEIAYSKFNHLVEIESKVIEQQKKIESRVLIEKAKGLLMKNKNLSEDEAYKIIRKISMDNCMSMQRVAKAIIKKLG